MSQNKSAAVLTADDEPPTKQKKITPVECEEAVDSGGNGTDFNIICDGQKFSVRKSVITDKSLYFKQLFDGPTCMQESQTNQIKLEGIPEGALQLAIEHMYGKDISISWSTVDSLLYMASRFLIDTLTDLCCDFLESKFDFDSLSDMFELCKTYSLDRLVDFIKDSISLQFEEFADTSHYTGLEYELLHDIVSRDNLNISSEWHLFQNLLNWLHTDDKNSEDCYSVLRHVRFCLMSLNELNEIKRSADFKSFPDSVQELVTKAVAYQQALTTAECGLRNAECVSMSSSIQNTLRNARPNLVLVNEGSLQNSFEIIAVREKCDRIDITTLLSDAAHHKLCGVVTLENCLYILYVAHLGGFDHHSTVQLSRFDLRSGREHAMPMPPLQVMTSGVAAVGNCIYLCGGVSRSNTVFVNNVQSFNIKTFEWSSEVSLNSSLHSCAAVGHKNCLYISGGLAENRLHTSSRVFSLQPGHSTEWREMAPMRLTRRDHAMVAIDDERLMVCGGMSTNLPQDYNRRIPLEIYCTLTNQWTEIRPTSALQGNSLGHYLILPDDPKTLYSLGHELYDAQEHEIWCTNLNNGQQGVPSEGPSDSPSDRLFVALPTRMKLNHTFAAYLNLNDWIINKAKSSQK